ncbi:MAG: hybrid sensor histidine kinase/response regulator, partial [Verrucomicrobia bacterium]|nr:hybrid sensor histidine kinase/response regulator [Verrucomicrobiota bacterium]
MNGHIDYRKFAVLYVDDEEKTLKTFRQAFENRFRILIALNAAEGFRLLEQQHEQVGLLMTDQRMPGEKGVRLLERVRQAYPRIVRVLATAYADIEAAISAVNTGAIYWYVTKPWEVVELEQVLQRGLEFFHVQHERDQLLREKLSAVHEMMIADRVICLGILAAGLNHHIRNSLVAVRTFMDLAPGKLAEERVNLDELRDPGFWRGFYEQVQAQIGRITGMLGDLGLASGQAPCQFNDSVELPALITEAVAGAAERLRKNQIKVEYRFGPGLPVLRADASKLHRLLDLLINNEATHLPQGSKIIISARALPAAGERAAEVEIGIQDNGPSLPVEALRSVFDPFSIRVNHPQELGIDLMACYFIVYHHGGRIQVKSQDQNGTIFLLTLPVSPQTQAPPIPEQEFMA